MLCPRTGQCRICGNLRARNVRAVKDRRPTEMMRLWRRISEAPPRRTSLRQKNTETANSRWERCLRLQVARLLRTASAVAIADAVAVVAVAAMGAKGARGVIAARDRVWLGLRSKPSLFRRRRLPLAAQNPRELSNLVPPPDTSQSCFPVNRFPSTV